MKRTSGIYTTLGTTRYFIPDPLPPCNPDFKMTKTVTALHDATLKSLKKLNDISIEVTFVRAYVLKEALLSSEIEGIHTTLLDVLTQSLETNPQKIPKNARLVLNYTHALNAALELIYEKDLPLSTRVLLHAHKTLMGSESQEDPGKYRRQAVRVGNLIPPPADRISSLMNDLETYINNGNDNDIPPLIRAGLAHVQFETIHPFLDGNGRIGRLLIVLMLLNNNLISLPILYPSLYFKRNRFEYYRWLDNVRLHGNFEGWIVFYLKAINTACKDAYKRIEQIEKVINKAKKTIASHKTLCAMNVSSDDLMSQFIKDPIMHVATLATGLKIETAIAVRIIGCCQEIKIITKKSHDLFHFKPYLDILDHDLF